MFPPAIWLVFADADLGSVPSITQPVEHVDRPRGRLTLAKRHDYGPQVVDTPSADGVRIGILQSIAQI